MKSHPLLTRPTFDKILFNFPLAAFKAKETPESWLRKNQLLMNGFFRNALQMLDRDGQVLVTNKTTRPYREWWLVEIAYLNRLKVIEVADFNKSDYPGYHQTCGRRMNADDPYSIYPAAIYKFARF